MSFLILLAYLFPLLYIIFQLCISVFQWSTDKCCYMLDYECYKATEDMRLSPQKCADIVLRNMNLGLQEYRFLLKTMTNSGIGEKTYGPRNIVIDELEENPSIFHSLSEMDDIFFEILDKLFAKSKISPSQIDILVVTVSLMSPMPSLTARIVNRYKMKPDIKAFNLSGMGCSASIVAIDIVQNLFKSCRNATAVVVSTESMASHWYIGKDRSMMLSNCIFRLGGCAMVFTNNRSLKNQAILKLKCMVRTHIGSDDEAYACCIQEEDNAGYTGFRLTKYLTKAGIQALTKNLTILLPKVLPVWELFRYALVSSLFSKKANSHNNPLERGGGLNLKSGIDHFCVHPGGRAVIEGVRKSLGLTEYDVEPARMALHRFGNTASGGLWYVLGYMEAKRRLKKGDRILMISLGAGFKCNNCVWEVVRDLENENVWKDCIDNYPPQNLVSHFTGIHMWLNDKSLESMTIDQIRSNFQHFIN